MKVIRHAQELSPGHRKVCLAIGMFDGVHLGHQSVILQTVTDAQRHDAVAVTVTFDRHPSTVVAPERTPPLICSLDQKLRAIGALGVEVILLLHFNHALSQQTGEVFIRGLARDFGQILSIAVGSNFAFGHRRSGNVALLGALGQDLGFNVHPLPPVALAGAVVSSTRIREIIRKGQLDLARQMLGRPYAVAGQVVKGDQMGRKLGFPTANLQVSGLVLPPSGVYAGYAQVQSQSHRAVANLGHRPTLDQSAPSFRFEVHLLDYNGELYGQELEFTFAQALREERRFASLQALREQIARDVDAARVVMG
jgi:riboflavin kinase / FMN adenylyltransferase